MRPATEAIMKMLASLGEGVASYGVDAVDGGFRAYINYTKESEMGGNWSMMATTELLAAVQLKKLIQDWLEEQQ